MKNITKFKKGMIPWNKGKKSSLITIEKLRLCNLGKKHKPETINKLRKMFSGKNHYNWKGGVTPLYYQIRRLFKYRQWRSDIFTRDNFTCIFCLDNKGGNLNADHIKPFFKIIEENNIDSIEKSIKCEELWDINNGRTLCEECHRKTETFGRKLFKKDKKNI